MLKELLKSARSYRRFYESEAMPPEVLRGLVELTRYTPSGANLQALKFRLVYEKEECGKVFPTLRWAAYLKDWPGPSEGERPSAYAVILCDETLGKNKQRDAGIAALAMMLGAAEQGWGGCIFGSIDRAGLAGALGIDPTRYAIELVLALGRPREEVVLEDVQDGDIRYYRDAAGVHHVPKRVLAELIVE